MILLAEEGGTFHRQSFFIILYLGVYLNPEKCPPAVFPLYTMIFSFKKKKSQVNGFTKFGAKCSALNKATNSLNCKWFRLALG